MEIGIIHYSLNIRGGGEKLCLTIIEALEEKGYQVRLITAEKTDWNKLRRIAGKDVKPDKEFTLFPFKLQAFGIYQRLINSFLAYKVSKDCDLTLNISGNVISIPCNIAYMHYIPSFLIMREKPEVIKKYLKSVFWHFYFIPYELIETKWGKWCLNKTFLLTNSSYTQKAIWLRARKKAKVIYPPVDTSRFFSPLNRLRENTVVTCARLAYEKNLDIIPEIASKVSDVHFIITGSASAKESHKVIKEIQRKTKELHCENVEIIPNTPFEILVRIYSKSKMYLHTMVGEHFGISVVEAMASGCVPIVHKSGGPWLDIIEQGKWGLGYNSVEEAASLIRYLMHDKKKFKEYQKMAQQRSKNFSEEKFKERILEVLDKFARHV